MTVQPRELGARPLVIRPKTSDEPAVLARGWGYLKRLGGPVLIHLFLLAMVIFALFPAFFVLQAAFRPGQSLYTLTLSLWPDHPTWDNFIYVWTQIPFPTWLRNSLGVAIGTMLSGLAGAATGAYALARFRFAGKRMTLILLLAIQAFPTVLALVPIYIILKTIGLIGSPFGLMLAYVASALVFATWNLKGYFDTIPRELDE